MSARIHNRTPDQQAVVQQLVEQFRIDPEKVLFLKREKPLEPWLNYEALTTIARQSGRFRSLSEHFATFDAGLKQVVHSATVIDANGFEYTRSGAARLGEVLFEDEEPDEHSLAAARALRLAFDSAGFDPVKAASVVPLDLTLSHAEHAQRDEVASRLKDLKQIHLLAAKKGLIRPSDEDASRNDMTEYREWLAQHFEGANSAAAFTPAQRAIAINLLRELAEKAL